MQEQIPMKKNLFSHHDKNTASADRVACWAVLTGRMDPFRPSSRKAVKFMRQQDGFAGVVLPRGVSGQIVWVFRTQNLAVRARNRAATAGIRCSEEICKVYVDPRDLAPQNS